MAKLLGSEFITERSCPYLADREACHEYRYLTEVTPEEMDALLDHGWRRFGVAYFQPVCQGCSECVSLRIPVAELRPSKSQRRARSKCAGLRVETGTPELDLERLDLYKAWHRMREAQRGWRENDLSAQTYGWLFCQPNTCAREMRYYLGSRLVAVGLVDETKTALSSVYFYFSPEIAWMSPGIFSVLCEVEYARERSLQYVYLGYRVQECPSVAYKNQFRPHEILVGRPRLEEPALWIRPTQRAQ